jgi:hypothetical protein
MNHRSSPQELICNWLMHGANDDRYFIALYETLAGKTNSLSSKGSGGPLLAYIMRKITSSNKREDAESVLTITFALFFKAIQQALLNKSKDRRVRPLATLLQILTDTGMPKPVIRLSATALAQASVFCCGS